jgi:hypothetical protein
MTVDIRQDHLEFKDRKNRHYDRQVWVPMRSLQVVVEDGEFNTVGYNKEIFHAYGLAVDEGRMELAKQADANRLLHAGDSRPFVRSDGGYVTADTAEAFFKDIQGIRLVLEQDIPGQEFHEWHLNQDFVLGLNLLRVGDTWVRVEEGRTVVATLERNSDGKPVLLKVKVEFLKDYLRARKMGLLLGTFAARVMVVEEDPSLPWDRPTATIEDAENGWRWRGDVYAVHEGGSSKFGSTVSVFHASRKDFDDEDEVPTIKHDGPMQTSRWTTDPSQGRKVYRVSGEFWRTEWIAPGNSSARVAGDEIPSTSYFVNDGAGTKVNGDDLKADGGAWLWFRPDIVNDALTHPDGQLEWYTSDTGGLTFTPGCQVHFGVNKLGFLNALGVDIGRLAHWEQAKWAAHNVPPSGQVSQELLAAQVHVNPADTAAPETVIPIMLDRLAEAVQDRYGITLYHGGSHVAPLLRITHRFRSLSASSLYGLAKDITRLFADRIDKNALRPALRPPAREDKTLGSLKVLEHLLATLMSADVARSTCGALFGIYELRLGDAHLPSAGLGDALTLANVRSTDPYVFQGMSMLIAFVCTLEYIASVIRFASETDD